MIPMGPTYGYPGDFDRNSSGEALGKPDKGWGRARREHGRVGVPSFAPECSVPDDQSLSVGGHSSQVPLMSDVDGSVSSGKNLQS